MKSFHCCYFIYIIWTYFEADAGGGLGDIYMVHDDKYSVFFHDDKYWQSKQEDGVLLFKITDHLRNVKEMSAMNCELNAVFKCTTAVSPVHWSNGDTAVLP